MTTFSVTTAAVELGVSKETIRRRLAEIGIKTGKGESFTLRQLFDAMGSDPRKELTRLRKAQADAEQRKNRVAEGELIEVEKAAQIYGRKLQAICQRVDAQASLLDSQLALESDPVKIRQILAAYNEQTKAEARAAQ
jgi:phage terminase Nu1 subunit (DNA packaging protein)